MSDNISSKEAIKIEKQRILEEEKLRKHRINEMIEASKPRKGSKKNDVYKLPMPSSHEVLTSKDICLKTYGVIMLHSNWGGKFFNPDDRYIYNNYIDEKIEQISLECSIAPKTLKDHIRKLKKCGIKIFEPMNINGELVYRLNYSIEGQEFITIDNIALRDLCSTFSSNALKLYIILSYACVSAYKEKGKQKYTVKRIEKHITQKWLCEKMGIAYSNRSVITTYVKYLKKSGFIKVREEYKLNNVTKNGKNVVHKVPHFYYSLSDDYLQN